jgi:non-heme chloroperoxidase
MSLGPFWTSVVHPVFEVAAQDSLNRLPDAERRAVFDRFGPESGRALFELFFWMFDEGRAAAVDLEAVRCPVLCLSGSDDRVVSPTTARATAAGLADAVFCEAPGRGHMLPIEPGAEEAAADIAACLAALPDAGPRRAG